MNTREQEYMLALDKTRSITRAAEQLHVTQPTLSLFLTNLEKRLGTPLFHRLGKKISAHSGGRGLPAPGTADCGAEV